MLFAEWAVLLDLHPFRMILLVFGQVVVTMLAFRACQSNSCTHNFHLALFIRMIAENSRLFLFPEDRKGAITHVMPSIRRKSITQMYFPRQQHSLLLPDSRHSLLLPILIDDSLNIKEIREIFRCTCKGTSVYKTPCHPHVSVADLPVIRISPES